MPAAFRPYVVITGAAGNIGSALAGAYAQGKLETLVPDALDRGEKPFVRPFMVAMADDHYALDIGRARKLLGWEPRYRIEDVLPKLTQALAGLSLRRGPVRARYGDWNRRLV